MTKLSAEQKNRKAAIEKVATELFRQASLYDSGDIEKSAVIHNSISTLNNNLPKDVSVDEVFNFIYDRKNGLATTDKCKMAVAELKSLITPLEQSVVAA